MTTFDVGKTPYFDIKDTIAEVGITRRQLNYWESEGLVQAELGPTSKKYTIDDIRRLKALRHLIVDRNLPFPLVKELVQGDVEQAAELSHVLIRTSALFDDNAPRLSDYVLNIEKGELQSKSDVANAWWHFHFATASENTLTSKVYELSLLLFRAVKVQSKRPAAFHERTTEILGHISQLVETARIDAVAWGDEPDDVYVELRPSYGDDPPFGLENLDSEFIRTAQTLVKYEKALAGGKRDRFEHVRYRQRVWSSETLARIAKLKNEPYLDDMDDMENIPF